MSFPLIGNEKTKLTIKSFLASGKLPHALIIAGETGLGKHTLARYIAAAAVCSNADKPCYKCHNCNAAFKDIHSDIIYIKREKDKKELGVKAIRDIKRDAFVIPHEAEKKVFIIEDADKMNASAGNALLKILEEPPSFVMFILLCSDTTALLDTVLSRAIVLRLAPVGEEGAKIISEAVSCDEDTALAALKNARGNIGKAITFAGKKTENTAREMARSFIDAFLSKNEYEMLKTLKPLEKDRAGLEVFFSELKAELCEKVKELPKCGKRAKAVFSLYFDMDEFINCAKLNAHLPLLFCTLTSRANNYMR